MTGLRKFTFFGLMHLVEIFIKDTWKFSPFLDNFAIPNKKIALILRLLMYFFKLVP